MLLHEHCPAVAKKVFELFSVENEVSRLAENVEQGSFYVLDLLTKSSCALARSDLLHDDDVSRICVMISEVHDPLLRVRLFARLAFFYWREGAHSHFSTIVNTNIWTELDGMMEGDKELLYRAWVNAYGVVWLENRDRARDAVAAHPSSVRYPAVRNFCFALLYKLPPGEPYDGRGKKRPAILNYSDIHTLLVVCDELEEDQAIFSVLEGIADQIANPDHSVNLTREQKAEVSRLMQEISEKRLPSAQGVPHLGYQIVCKAQFRPAA